VDDSNDSRNNREVSFESSKSKKTLTSIESKNDKINIIDHLKLQDKLNKNDKSQQDLDTTL